MDAHRLHFIYMLQIEEHKFNMNEKIIKSLNIKARLGVFHRSTFSLPVIEDHLGSGEFLRLSHLPLLEVMKTSLAVSEDDLLHLVQTLYEFIRVLIIRIL